MPETATITEIAVGSDDFNILVTALTETGLVGALPGLGEITVFAPTDAAFTKLAIDLGFTGDSTDEGAVFGFIAGALEGLAGSPEGALDLLAQILLYHVSPGAQTTDDINGSGTVSTAQGSSFTAADNVLTDADELTNPTILASVEASNGIIQVIDRVLIPIDIPGTTELPSITEIAIDNGFTILVEALVRTDLVDAIPTLGDITVFAPTNQAFLDLAGSLGYAGSDDPVEVINFFVDALAPLGGGDGIAVLSNVLLYHVSPGAQTTAGVNSAGTITTALEGTTFQAVDGELVDNDPDVANPEIAAQVVGSNGVVQVVDAVLLPVNLDNGNAALFLGDEGRDRSFGTRNDDELFGFDGNDYLNGGRGADLIVGGEGRDVLVGGGGKDELIGEDGNDRLLGGSGKDVLDGGAGRDFLAGGFGADILIGGEGSDLMFGGFGTDTFEFDGLDGYDIIGDFNVRTETIEIKGEFGSFEELKDASFSTFFGTLVRGEDGYLFIAGVRESQLDEDNFILS